MDWMASIIVAVITGIFSYLGVAKATKNAHEQTLIEIKAEQKHQSEMVGQQINSIKSDIKRLEDKQDKHNAVIERTYKLEQKVDDLEKRVEQK